MIRSHPLSLSTCKPLLTNTLSLSLSLSLSITCFPIHALLLSPILAVWPYVEIKSIPIFSKVAQKTESTIFYFKSDAFKRAKKVTMCWSTFVRKFVAKIFWNIAQSGHTEI